MLGARKAELFVDEIEKWSSGLPAAEIFQKKIGHLLIAKSRLSTDMGSQ